MQTIRLFSDNINNGNIETSLNAGFKKNEWLQINKLSLSVSNSKYIIFFKSLIKTYDI